MTRSEAIRQTKTMLRLLEHMPSDVRVMNIEINDWAKDTVGVYNGMEKIADVFCEQISVRQLSEKNSVAMEIRVDGITIVEYRRAETSRD